MKMIIKHVAIAVVLLFLAGCAVTHKYGPYYGKIVDADTGKPISDAVIFMKFYTNSPSVGGNVGHYAGAIEVLSGENGEFYIEKRIISFRLFHGWDRAPIVFVWKRG
ncbi:MAG: hypothetical protein GY707_16335 [Desulfobacteraceae bacterium]|nr:hypothetical protein [Desulfobacteraceae bacterium]